jgi:uncharacterized SAM-binding protein YcdF (DUF218 family)
MFGLSSLIHFMLHPLSWVAVLLVIGLLRLMLSPRPKAGRNWVGAALLLLVFLGWELPPTLALRTLESRYPAQQVLPADLQGMVILGGSTDRSTLVLAGQSVPLNEAAERLTQGVALAKQHPQWAIVYSGGNGRFWVGEHEWSEAKLAQMFFHQQGLDTERILFEDRSRNTRENARLSARLPGVDKQAKWLLVTSAWHMPRALAVFEQEGWNVHAYPVDFRADPRIHWVHYSFKHGPLLWQTYIHERVGMLATRLFHK